MSLKRFVVPKMYILFVKRTIQAVAKASLDVDYQTVPFQVALFSTVLPVKWPRPMEGAIVQDFPKIFVALPCPQVQK